MGAFVEGEMNLIMDAIFSYPIHCLLFLVLFLLVFFIFKGKYGGHCLGLVTRGDNVTHKHFTEMRRSARDDTPFLLAMPPRATTLVW
jgi:hypothetical protein